MKKKYNMANGKDDSKAQKMKNKADSAMGKGKQPKGSMSEGKSTKQAKMMKNLENGMTEF
jgi:hypothetical protein